MSTTVNHLYEGSVTKLATGAVINWSTTLRNASTGTSATTRTSTASANVGSNAFQGSRGASAGLTRAYFFFDLSSISGTITDMTLKIYNANLAALVGSIIVKSTAWGSSGTSSTLTTSDFSNIDFSTAYSSEKVSWSGTGYNDFTLNSTAVSDANSNSYLNVALLESDHDYGNNTPSFSPATNDLFQVTYANISNQNKLEITTSSGFSEIIMGKSVLEGAGGGYTKIIGVSQEQVGQMSGVDA